jgi:hypothetical protein
VESGLPRQRIGIEHAGYASQQWTHSLYHASATLSAYLCRRFNILVSHDYIRGHRSVPGMATRCPGGGHFNEDTYLRLVRRYR